MADFERDVRRLLSEHGRYFFRHGMGGDDIWFSRITTRKITVDDGIKSRHTANAIIKQAGIEHRF